MKLKQVNRHGIRQGTTNKVDDLMNFAKDLSSGRWIKSKDFFFYFDEETKSIKPITYKFNLSASYGRPMFIKHKIFEFMIINKIEYVQWNEETNIANISTTLHTEVYNYKLERKAKAEKEAKAVVTTENKVGANTKQNEIVFPEFTEQTEAIPNENENVNDLGIQEETLEDNYETLIFSLIETTKLVLESNKSLIETNNLILDKFTKVFIELNKKNK